MFSPDKEKATHQRSLGLNARVRLVAFTLSVIRLICESNYINKEN
jgi:hypothetical protein